MSKTMFPLLSIAALRMGTDGNGVTTLVAGAGCPLSCKWCINKKLLQEAVPENITAEELLKRVSSYDLYYRATVCPSEWRITVETSLFVPRSYLAAVTDAVDLFIVDCKDMNEEIYRNYTGEDGTVMSENLEFLLRRVGPDNVLVRVPGIPGFNTEEDRKKSVQKLRDMGAERLDLFDYMIRN